MSRCVAKASCPKCDSGDAVQIFEQDDGKRDAHCYACEADFRNVEGLTIVEDKPKREWVNKISVEDVLSFPSLDLKDRRIRKDILDYYGVKVGLNGADRTTIDHHFYPCHTESGELTGYKQRICKTKDFTTVGKTKDCGLFGQQQAGRSASKNKLFITEGEIDAMALYQVMYDGMQQKWRDKGFLPCVVSLPTGVAAGANKLLDNIKFLKRFQEIVIVFDSDDAGRQGAEKVAKLIDHKILLAHLPLKDAGEMLVEHRETELYSCVLKEATAYEPDGILNANTAWDRYKERKTMESFPYPPQFKELNEKTYGYRRGSVVTITSGSGMGKSTFIKELCHDILTTSERKLAIIALEEDVGDSIEGLMAIDLNKRISLPDVEVTDEEEKASFEKLFGDGRVELYDHFGGMDDGDLLSRIKYFNTYLGCTDVILDHLSIVISETADQGDERRRIDAVMTKLAKIAKTLDIVIFLVVHLRKAGQGKSFEEGYVPTSDDLRGSAAIKQLSSDIIALSRNQQEKDEVKRNTSGLHVLKCRFSGDTGQAGYSFFDPLTGRMVRGEDPTIETIDEESEF